MTGTDEEQDGDPTPDSGHGAISGFSAKPSPDFAESHLRNPETNLVREPLSKPVKEEEDAQARAAISDQFFGEAAGRAGPRRHRPARLVARLATPAARPALARRARADRGGDRRRRRGIPPGASRTARWAKGAGPRHAARRPAQGRSMPGGNVASAKPNRHRRQSRSPTCPPSTPRSSTRTDTCRSARSATPCAMPCWPGAWSRPNACASGGCGEWHGVTSPARIVPLRRRRRLGSGPHARRTRLSHPRLRRVGGLAPRGPHRRPARRVFRPGPNLG